MNEIGVKKYLFIVVFLLNIPFFIVLHGQQFRSYLDEGLISENIDADSIYGILNGILKDAIKEKDSSLIVRSLISLSAFERKKLEYGSAFSHAGEALFMAEEVKDSLLVAKSHEELGVLSYLYKQDEDAGFNFKRAHTYYKALFGKNKIEFDDLYQSYYNLLMYYQRIENRRLLEVHIDSCRRVVDKLMLNDINRIHLNEKKSSLKEWAGKPNEALEFLFKSAKNLEELEADSEVVSVDRSFLIIVFGRIGVIYMGLGDLYNAKKYFNKSVAIEDVTGENIFYKSFVYSQYAQLLSIQGLYKNAYENEQQAKFINDTYLNPRNDRNKGFLTVRNRYKDELVKKNELLNLKNLELANKQQDILQFRILLFVILFLGVVLGLIVLVRVRLLKHQRKERDSKAVIQVKNKELTTNTLKLIEKEEIIKKLSDFIKESNTERNAKSLLKSIENRSESLWDAFSNRFNEQNVGFYERLQHKIPDLSGADLKLCALIKLNFSGKEMAYLLGISLGSVHVARHRLRKKMNLNREVNLTNFVNSI